ncbi:MAG: entericidin [Verrucomicrobia bacterium]|nr:MAG: entericidin [Verrucomicrobiota bacterium]
MKSILLLAAVAVATLLSSCNTVIGFGRDLRMMGDGVEKSANKVHGGHSDTDTSGAPVY